MILASKIFFGALQTDLDPEIRISGSKDLFFRIFGSRSFHRAHRKFLLAKTIYGLQLLLLAHFDWTPPSWGSPYKCSAM